MPVHTIARSSVRDVRDGQPLVAEPRAPTSPGGEQLAAKRLEDRGRGHSVGVAHRDRRARERDAVGVVRRAVERVDEPGARPVGLARDAFLSEDRMVRERGEP